MEYARNNFMMAAAVQYTLPGVPCLYYGDEAGLCGMADPFNRGTYPWGREDEELVKYFQTLGQLRRSHDGLTSKGCAMWGKGDIFALCRNGVITIVNRGKKTRVVLKEEDFVGDMRADLSGRYKDILTGSVYMDMTGTIILPAETAMILVKE